VSIDSSLFNFFIAWNAATPNKMRSLEISTAAPCRIVSIELPAAIEPSFSTPEILFPANKLIV